MSTELIRWHLIPLGVCNAYLIEGPTGAVLVDAGLWKWEGLIFRYLQKHGIAPSRIKLVIVTHAHFDHVGGLKKIRDVCRCPVGIHPADGAAVGRGEMIFPPGTNRFGKIASAVGRSVGGPLVRYAPVEADLLITEEIDLAPFGVPGTIIPTPGHTAGSLSILLPGGVCFVGDSTANIFPAFLDSVLPPFAEDLGQLLKSWRVLLDRGMQLICPGHGAPFQADRLQREVISLELKISG